MKPQGVLLPYHGLLTFGLLANAVLVATRTAVYAALLRMPDLSLTIVIGTYLLSYNRDMILRRNCVQYKSAFVNAIINIIRNKIDLLMQI